MDWIQDAQRKLLPDVWRAEFTPYKFIITHETDSQQFRVTFCHPKEGDYCIVRCPEFGEAQRFAEWVLRAYCRSYQ